MIDGIDCHLQRLVLSVLIPAIETTVPLGLGPLPIERQSSPRAKPMGTLYRGMMLLVAISTTHDLARIFSPQNSERTN